jgi:excisionase family DNA binding protein
VSETPRIFDLLAAVAYVQSLGANGVTIHTIRLEIASGRIAHTKLGKKFYVSKQALDNWITRAERRARG